MQCTCFLTNTKTAVLNFSDSTKLLLFAHYSLNSKKETPPAISDEGDSVLCEFNIIGEGDEKDT